VPVLDPSRVEPVVQLTGLGRRFGSDPAIDALVDVNLRVQQGEWLAIVGPSGSGKSTLLNIVGCLDLPTTGSYTFRGIDVGDLPDKQRAGLRSRGIGFVFQSFHLLSHRTVVENVMLADIYRNAPTRGRREKAIEALDKVGLSARAESLPPTLSGGERQRVAIARALAGEPDLLLCDEPTGNLDSVTTRTILEILGDLHRRGMTMLVITHEQDVAERAQRHARIIDGRLSEVT
jgi:ABC-type lipoprotein export system ATPase subunit